MTTSEPTSTTPEPVQPASPAAETAAPAADSPASTATDKAPADKAPAEKKKATPKKPATPRPPSPAALAKKRAADLIPVAPRVSAEDIAAAAAFGEVEDGKVFVKDGAERHEVGVARGDDAITPYAEKFFELKSSIERFAVRLGGTDLTVKDLNASLKSFAASLEKPTIVGDLTALRLIVDGLVERGDAIRARLSEEHEAAKATATTEREAVVAAAEALAAKPENKIHWKNDTTALRDLLDSWKDAQKNGARLNKDIERELWKRFTTARSSFEKARKAHFATLDKENSTVATAKEALVAKAEALRDTTDWDAGARGFRDLMVAWKASGRGRRTTDDALWKKFQTAQDAFFEAKRQVGEAEEASLAENVPAKEALVVEAEKLLPIKDLQAVKEALRGIQDRFEAVGMVPRADMGRLNKRMSVVEGKIREADDARWTKHNPEVEARVSGLALQLTERIAELEVEIAAAKKAGDKGGLKKLEDELTTRKSWLEGISAS